MTVAIEDIAVALGREVPADTSAEGRQWSMWIADARMLIATRLGDLNELDQARLDYVVREAVAAQVRRPDDSTSVEVAVDDGRVAKRYSSSRGRVFIRDEWWALLDPNRSKSGAFTINLVPAGATYHRPWCAVYFGALYCSCGADIAGYPIYEGA